MWSCDLIDECVQMSFHSVVECLQRMTCRNGKKVLSVTEIHNLVTLCPTDEEIKLVKGYHGDTNKLAQVGLLLQEFALLFKASSTCTEGQFCMPSWY